jgi:thermitase
VPAGKTPEQAIQDLISQDGGQIDFARVNHVWKALNTPNDPLLGSEYQVTKADLTTAWDSTTGTGVTIAIADTGVMLAHPDLAAHLLSNGFNFGDSNSNVDDQYGHGTGVAGMAAAIGNNSAGVAGAAFSASILPIKVSPGGSDSTTDVEIIQAIEYAADHGAKVVNVSFGSDVCGLCAADDWDVAIQYMRGKGGVVTIAAGNSACSMTCNAHPGAVIVSATNSADQLAFFSNFGPAIDVAAPGLSVWTTNCNACNGTPPNPFNGKGDYWNPNGTSYSAPFVAGVLGLIYAVNPSFTSDQATQILYDSADDLGTPGRDDSFGHGRVNAARAVALAAGRATTTQQNTVANVYAYPNPWDVRKGFAKQVHFNNLPTGGTVKIFTLSGVFVASLSESNNQATWTLTNDSGQDVASGLYLYLATSNAGDKARGKIAVIR